MKLGSLFVWFPVLHLRAEVTYRLLPELTPLHRALETAVKEFWRGGNSLATVPIPALFSQLFGVSGAKEILPDVLDDLIERGRVHRVVEDGSDPSLLRIIDLAPGRCERDKARGPTLSETDKQASQTRQIERFFDPVLEEIVGADSLAPQPRDHHHFCVPSEPFLMNPPIHWVEPELRAELRDDLQVYSAAADLIGCRWRHDEAIILLKDGELSVECGDKRQSAYLRGLSQIVRRSWLLPSSVDGSRQSIVEEGAALSIHCHLPLNLGGLALTRGLPKTVRAGLALPLSVVLVELDPTVSTRAPTLIPASAERQAMQVSYSHQDDPGIDGVFLASEGREYLRLPVIWEGLHAEIGVFRATLGFQQDGSVWSNVIAALESECRFSDSPEFFVLPAFWLDPADFWNMLSERSESETDGQAWVAKIVEELTKLPLAVLERMEESFFCVKPMEHLRRSYSELDKLFPSAQAQLAKNTPENNGIAPVPKSCTRVVVFDTASFIRYDRLVEHLRPSDFLVTPQVVAAEVERRKIESEDFRIISRRNLRAIDALPKERWTAPFHDFDLLNPGDKNNNDGAIIATLVPYSRLGLEVIVVSEDHDFLLRCRPYGIEWMNAESFLHMSRNVKRET
jgi:hypothetical protein